MLSLLTPAAPPHVAAGAAPDGAPPGGRADEATEGAGCFARALQDSSDALKQADASAVSLVPASTAASTPAAAPAAATGADGAMPGQLVDERAVARQGRDGTAAAAAAAGLGNDITNTRTGLRAGADRQRVFGLMIGTRPGADAAAASSAPGKGRLGGREDAMPQDPVSADALPAWGLLPPPTVPVDPGTPTPGAPVATAVATPAAIMATTTPATTPATTTATAATVSNGAPTPVAATAAAATTDATALAGSTAASANGAASAGQAGGPKPPPSDRHAQGNGPAVAVAVTASAATTAMATPRAAGGSQPATDHAPASPADDGPDLAPDAAATTGTAVAGTPTPAASHGTPTDQPAPAATTPAAQDTARAGLPPALAAAASPGGNGAARLSTPRDAKPETGHTESAAAPGATPVTGTTSRALRAPADAARQGTARDRTPDRADRGIADPGGNTMAVPANAPAAATATGAGPVQRFADQLQAAMPAAPAAVATTPSSAAPAGPATHAAHLSPPLASPDFPPALGAQVSLFARDGVERATIEINPPEMGPISVQISLDGSGARVDFLADAAATRQVIEAALPTLASSLRDAGLTLTGGGVFQQPQSSANGSGQGGSGQPGQGQNGRPGGRADDGAGTPTSVIRTTAQRGLVDLVA